MRAPASLLPLAAALLVAACSDGPTSGNDVLTPSEAAALMRATKGQLDVGSEPVTLSGSAAQTAALHAANVAAQSFAVSFQESEPCENQGGRIDISGTITIIGDEAPTGIELSATMIPVRCAVPTEDATVYEINGDPNFAVQLSMAFEDGLPVGIATQTIKGKFTWRSGARSGSCSVDLISEFDVALNRDHTRGTFCGIDVDEVETL